MQQKDKGFTLLELMVVLAIAGILMTWGVSSFQNMVRNNRLTTVYNDFVAALHFARSEAVTRNASVTVCKSSNGTSCTGNWEDGWITFTDADGDAVVDAGTDEILKVQSALGNSLTLSGNNNVTTRVTFANRGATSNNGTLTLCDPRGASDARGLVISNTGRIRKETGGLTC